MSNLGPEKEFSTFNLTLPVTTIEAIEAYAAAGRLSFDEAFDIFVLKAMDIETAVSQGATLEVRLPIVRGSTTPPKTN